MEKQRRAAEAIGDRHVFAFVSGGVDSTGATALVASVIDPEKFHAYYINNGFMRTEDDDMIAKLKAAGINVTLIDATERFLPRDRRAPIQASPHLFER